MQKKDYIYLGIILLLAIAFGVERYNNFVKPLPKNTYVYQTDTNYLKKEYKKLVEELNSVKGLIGKIKETPPKNIYYYNTTNNNSPVNKIPDSLIYVIPKTNERVVIADNYIKNFPKSDKLVDFTLNREEFKIGTVDILGRVSQKDWPLYLDHYDYYWYGNTLHHVARKKPYEYKDPNRWKKFYVNTGYDYIQQRALMGLDYNLEIGRFKIQADIKVLINKEPEMFSTTTLHYRLFK